MPFKTVVCERALEAEGVMGNISMLGECQLFLVPLDSDVLSMEYPSAYRECALLSDHTPVYHAAHAIMQLQAGHRGRDVAVLYVCR